MLSKIGIERNAMKAKGDRVNLKGNWLLSARILAASAGVNVMPLQFNPDKPAPLRRESVVAHEDAAESVWDCARFTRKSGFVYSYEFPPQPVLRFSVGAYWPCLKCTP